MTRVHVTGVGFVLLIPDCWSCWTYGGQVYRRRLGVVEFRIGKRWLPVRAVEIYDSAWAKTCANLLAITA